MEMLAAFAIILAFLSQNSPMKDVPQEELALYSTVPGVSIAEKHTVKPLSRFKEENIVKQKYDYSCGSAALATLLKYYLGEDLSEEQVIQGLMEYGDTRSIEERRAFSLLDMKQFVSVLGYQGAGYTAEIEDLKALKKPCIIPIEFFGYKHFVVFRGIYDNHVFIADPYMGNNHYPISSFQKMWYKNILFMVTTEGPALSALRLKEDDLRLVSFDIKRDMSREPAIPGIVLDQRNFMETIGKEDNHTAGKYQYRTIGVK